MAWSFNHRRFCPDQCFHCVMNPKVACEMAVNGKLTMTGNASNACPWQLAAYQINKLRVDGIGFTFEESSYHAQALGKKCGEGDLAWRKRLDATVVETPELPAACRFVVSCGR
jgi:hypothetical protein